MMEVYMDLVVLLNFLVDYLLLWGTEKLSGFPGSGRRCALAAAVGAVYAGACMLPQLAFLGRGLWQLAALAAMVVIAFGWKVSALRRGVLFFLLSMALGGLAVGSGSRGMWALVLAGAGLWLLCMVGFGGGTLGSTYVPVTICYRGKTAKLTALVDTGNTLKDPISGRPVLVADSAVAQRLLCIPPQALAQPLQTLASGTYPGLRLIPYSAVGQEAGMLLAILPEQVWIGGKKADVLVAFAPQRIGQGRPFEALAGGTV